METPDMPGRSRGGKPRSTRVLTMALMLAVLALPDPAPAAQAGTAKPGHIFMWTVKGPASKAYILGSLHVLRKGVYPLDPRIEKAYESCPRVVLEADPSGSREEDLRDTMIRLGTFQDTTTLKDKVSPETYGRLKERIQANKIETDRFERFRPWFAAFSIATLELKRLGFTTELGIDAHFYKKARADHRQMYYLETAGQQLKLLAGVSSGREEEILRQALDELDVVEKSSSDMIKAWKEGDARRMETLLKKSLEGFPDIEKKLFTERNTTWADAVGKLLSQKGDVFVVVGAGHLVGKNGLLELLRSGKFTVEQQ